MRDIKWSQQTIVAALSVALFIGLSVTLPGFLTGPNLLALLQSVAVLGLLAVGMGIIVIGRGIDLSMIATLAIPPALMLQMVQDGHDPAAAFAAALVLTLIFGLINGWLITYADVPALFVTLASGIFLSGLGQVAFFSIDIVLWPARLDALNWLGQSSLLGMPVPVIVFAAAVALMGLILNRTKLGRFVYASGDNPATARISGIPTRPMTVLIYVFGAMIGAFAGLVMAATLNTMPTRVFNSTLIYDVILVVVLGGIGLSGGRGGTSSVLIGTLLIGMLLNAMTLMNASFSVQNLVKGFILLTAVIADSIINPRNEETAQQGDI